MAVANRPLKRRRRTAQRGKPMTQSQRWGKVVTTMTPVPQGVISTSTGPAEATPSVVEQTIEEAIIEADAEEATEEYVLDEVQDES